MFYLVGFIMLIIGAICGHVARRWRLDATIAEYWAAKVLSGICVVVGILLLSRGAGFIGAV